MSAGRARKLTEGELIAAARAPGSTRLILLFGSDESLADDIARRLCAAVVEAHQGDAEAVDLDSAALRTDPARLTDEAAALSLFGGGRYIRLRIARGDDALAAVENLLAAPTVGNMVIATAGNLTPTSKLRKLCEAASAALTFACYPPTDRDAQAHIAALAEAEGVKLDKAGVARIHAATHGDRTLAAREVEKIALYLDAAPDAPKAADADTLNALSADSGEENLGALMAAVLGGDGKRLGHELASAAFMGLAPVRVIRAMQRRTAQLMTLRSKVDQGEDAESVVERDRSIFFKEKGAIRRELSLWSSPRLATLNHRLVMLEGQIMAHPGSMTQTLFDAEMTALCRAARRR